MVKQRFLRAKDVPKRKGKGPNGWGLCRWCGAEVPKGRRTWCGDACIREYLIRSNARSQEAVVFGRDAAVCDICGVNADIVRSEYLEKKAKINKEIDDSYWENSDDFKGRNKIRKQRLNDLAQQYKEKGWNVDDLRWWNIDHILPVSEGGGPHQWPKTISYLNNLRTLCHICHKAETAVLKKRLAKKK